jgi:ATP-binding cassette subfamily B protein
VTFASLRDTVGYVTQDAHLFHDTIRANLVYAKPNATDAELWHAVEEAQIAGLVRSLPAGLDTVVGERGYRLSGGEKQRLAIARLLLKAPRVVVLDEATAHLDSESEALVQRAFSTALAGRTALVIAHRLSTVRTADTIVVLDEGRVVETGTHDALLAAGGLYSELYRTQFDAPVAPQAP